MTRHFATFNFYRPYTAAAVGTAAHVFKLIISYQFSHGPSYLYGAALQYDAGFHQGLARPLSTNHVVRTHPIPRVTMHRRNSMSPRDQHDFTSLPRNWWCRRTQFQRFDWNPKACTRDIRFPTFGRVRLGGVIYTGARARERCRPTYLSQV